MYCPIHLGTLYIRHNHRCHKLCLTCRWLKIWALHFCSLFWVWRFLLNTDIFLINTGICYMGRGFCCSSHPRTLNNLISGHFWVDTRNVLTGQAVDKLVTLIFTLHWYIWNKQSFGVFYFSWVSWHLISGHIWVDTKTVFATRMVLTQQVINTLEHCRQGWSPHWTDHTTCRLWTSGHAYMHIEHTVKSQTKLLKTSGLKKHGQIYLSCKWSYKTLSSSPSYWKTQEKFIQ